MDQYFMQEAIKQGKCAWDEDEVPVGAVITYQGSIIAKAHNQVETLKDPTAHAEMIAITQATHHLSCKWLIGCVMYVTVEPCSMCAGALILARIDQVYFGAQDLKTGACGSLFNIVRHARLNHHIDIHQGLLSEQCGQMMSNFFQQKRSTKRFAK